MLIKSKMETADGFELDRVMELRPMIIVDEEVSNHLYRYRHHLIILLEISRGTRYESFRQRLIDLMVNNVYRYIETMKGRKSINFDDMKKHLMEVIYRNLLNAIVDILRTYTTSEQIREAYNTLLEYHYQGIGRFLE